MRERIRKTMSVEDLRNLANDMLLHSADNRKEAREGIMCFIESVLDKTGNYNGFLYLSKGHMEKSKFGHTVGINDAESYEEKFKDTDSTRIYFI